jgi:hypothetical protein
METALLTALPLLCVLVALVYAAVAGTKAYRSAGRISILGIAAALLGLAVGRLLDRFVPVARALGNPVDYHSMRVEVALLFIFASAVAALAVTIARHDLAGQPGPLGPRRFSLLAAVFLLAVGIAARGKVAVCVSFLLAKAGLF